MNTYEARDNATQYNAETQVFGATPEEVQAQIATATAPLATLNAGQQAEIVRLSIVAHEAGLTDARLLALARPRRRGGRHREAFAELGRAVTVAVEVQARGARLQQAIRRRSSPAWPPSPPKAATQKPPPKPTAPSANGRPTSASKPRRASPSLRPESAPTSSAATPPRRPAASPEARPQIGRPRRPLRCPAQGTKVGYMRGRDKGLSSDLEVSIEIPPTARAREDAERGCALNDLGNALQGLGDRERGTERLEHSATAYRPALEENTRERFPLDWAMTQKNLGTALRHSGSARAAPARLEQAVNAPRRARGVDPRARPARLGEDADEPRQRTLEGSASARADGAARAGGRRLPRRPGGATRERVPLDWARTQMNLGNCARRPRRPRERHGAARGGGRRLPRRAGGTDPRARPARLGDGPR